MCKVGLANESRHHLLILHKQAHDKRGIAESIHAYISRTRGRPTAFDVGVFLRKNKTTNSLNMPTPIFEEQLKLTAHGRMFGRLWYFENVYYSNFRSYEH